MPAPLRHLCGGDRQLSGGTGRSPPELMRHYLTVHLEYLNPEWLSVAAEGRVALNRREKGHTPRGAACHSRKRALFAIIVEAQRRTEGEPRTHLIRNHNQPAPRLYSDSSKSAAAEGRHTGRNYRVRPAARSPRNGRHWERRSSVQKNRPALTQAGIFPTGSQDRRYRPHDHKSSETWYCFGLP